MCTPPITVTTPVKTALATVNIANAAALVPLDVMRELARGQISDRLGAVAIAQGDRVVVSLLSVSDLKVWMSRAEYEDAVRQARACVAAADEMLA